LQRREISLITLVLNSPCIDLDLLKDLAARSVLIGVDGGLNSIIGLGLKPEWAVGDFDSVNPEIMKRLTRETKILRFPVEKDYTDIELALNLAGKYKPKLLNVLGLWGESVGTISLPTLSSSAILPTTTARLLPGARGQG